MSIAGRPRKGHPACAESGCSGRPRSHRRTPPEGSVLGGRTNETAEMFTVDADVYAAAGLLSERVENCRGRTAEHLDPYRRVERLRVGRFCPLPHNRHVRFHRVGVRVELPHGDFVSRLVCEFVERDQPWLAGLDEVDELRYAASFSF